MTDLNKYIALDLGSSKFLAIAAEIQEDNRLKILADEFKHSDDVKYGIVEQATGAAFNISEIIKLLQNSSKIALIEQVAVSVGAKSMKSHSVTISRFVGAGKIVTDALIAEMYEECEKKISGDNIVVLDVIPLIYQLDGRKFDDPVGEKGVQINGMYTVIYGNKKITDELERCFDRTGKIIEFRPISSESLAASLLIEEDKENGCALIDFGALTTTLSIYHSGALQQLIVVPLGGKNITKDIQEIGINETFAERLKCLKGVAMESFVQKPIKVQIPSEDIEKPPVNISTKFLATIIEARLEEIMQPIFEILKKYSEKLEAGIIISGEASKLSHIIEFIEERTGIEARHGDHSRHLNNDTDEKFFDIKYSVLIGTLLLLKEYRKNHPGEELEKKKKPKLPRKTLKDRFADWSTGFFSDDNKFETDSKEEPFSKDNKE